MGALAILAVILTYSITMANYIKSKGLNVLFYLSLGWAAGIGGGIGAAYLARDASNLATLGAAVAGFVLGGAFVWWIVFDKKAAPGAPGAGYLDIDFSCPDCGQAVSFSRRKRGLVKNCPHCGELLQVPDDTKVSSGVSLPSKPQGNDPTEWVHLRTFQQQYLADLSKDILQDAGIEVTLSADDAGGTVPFLQGSTGVRLRVQLRNWDEAQKILLESEQAGSDS